MNRVVNDDVTAGHGRTIDPKRRSPGKGGTEVDCRFKKSIAICKLHTRYE